jgi:hypothetical protein
MSQEGLELTTQAVDRASVAPAEKNMKYNQLSLDCQAKVGYFSCV